MTFEQFRDTHDPNGRKDWTFPFRLNTGEAIQSAVVDVVDADSVAVDSGTDLVIETLSIGLISGTTWGITVWISGGSAPAGDQKNYYLRCRIETNATPLSRKADKTAVLVCAQT